MLPFCEEYVRTSSTPCQHRDCNINTQIEQTLTAKPLNLLDHGLGHGDYFLKARRNVALL